MGYEVSSSYRNSVFLSLTHSLSYSPFNLITRRRPPLSTIHTTTTALKGRIKAKKVFQNKMIATHPCILLLLTLACSSAVTTAAAVIKKSERRQTSTCSSYSKCNSLFFHQQQQQHSPPATTTLSFSNWIKTKTSNHQHPRNRRTTRPLSRIHHHESKHSLTSPWRQSV